MEKNLELQEAKHCLNYRACKFDWLCSDCMPPFLCVPEKCSNFHLREDLKETQHENKNI